MSDVPSWFHRLLMPGAHGPDVLSLQRVLGAVCTGSLDDETMALLRGVQALSGLERTGLCDEATASRVGDTARRLTGEPPTWYGTDRQDARVVELVGDRDAVRRFQSDHGLRPSGIVDRRTALHIGE